MTEAYSQDNILAIDAKQMYFHQDSYHLLACPTGAPCTTPQSLINFDDPTAPTGKAWVGSLYGPVAGAVDDSFLYLAPGPVLRVTR